VGSVAGTVGAVLVDGVPNKSSFWGGVAGSSTGSGFSAAEGGPNRSLIESAGGVVVGLAAGAGAVVGCDGAYRSLGALVGAVVVGGIDGGVVGAACISVLVDVGVDSGGSIGIGSVVG